MKQATHVYQPVRFEQVSMPGQKELRCLDKTAKPDSWQQAGVWASEDAETLAMRRGIVGDALREALPDLVNEILEERPDWLALYAEAQRARGYQPTVDRPVPTVGPLKGYLRSQVYPQLASEVSGWEIAAVMDFHKLLEDVMQARQSEVSALLNARRTGRA